MRPLNRRELKLFNDHLSYARATADRYWRRVRPAAAVADHDDLRSFAMTGLCRAVRRYRRQRGKFLTYATHIIRHAITDGLRQSDWWGRKAWRSGWSRAAIRSLDAPVCDEKPLMAYLALPGGDSAMAALETTDLLDAISARLPSRYRLVMDGLRQGRTQRQIAHAMGVTEGHVSIIRRQLFALCRDRLASRIA